MNALIFSAVVSFVASVAVVGAICWYVCGWIVLEKTGTGGWQILIPVWGPYQLFKAAHSITLFILCFAFLGLTALFWFLPRPEVSLFWVLFLALAALCYGWSSVCLAQMFGLKLPWQVLAALLPPYFYAAVSADRDARYDWFRAPAAARPFWRIESALYEQEGWDVAAEPGAREFPAGFGDEGPAGGYEFSDAAARAYGMESLHGDHAAKNHGRA